MPENGSNDPEYREADDIQETHANMFQIAPSGEFAALYFGEQQFEIRSDGSSELTEVVYDTKVKMTAESARQLHGLLEDVLYGDEDEAEHSPGVQ